MKRSAPRSRTRCTQPSRTTSEPTSFAVSTPAVWVRASFPRGVICIVVLPASAGSQDLRDRRARNADLLAGLQILDRDLATGDLVAAEDRRKRDVLPGGVFHLLAQLVRLRVELGADA